MAALGGQVALDMSAWSPVDPRGFGDIGERFNMLKANELKPGKTIMHEGAMYTVKEATTVAKGNKASYKALKLKNIQSGQIIDYRARVEEVFETPFVESKDYEYLYYDGNDYVMADPETYDQFPISPEQLGDQVKFLKENTTVTCELVDGQIINVNLPNTVELQVTDTPPVVKGATVTNQKKDATLETGAVVKVPGFIEPGEMLRIDTRSGEYLERAK
jgi:elongation factor P